MNLDDLLHDTLHDDRWALPVPADTLDRVRRSRRHRRQGFALAGSGLSVAAVVAGAALVGSLSGGRGASLVPYSDGLPAGSAAPMISPDWVPQSGADWLMTNAEYDAFYAGHTKAPYPSPGPGQSRVASPAPFTQKSADLLAEVQAAGLPAGTTYRREDSPGGDPDETAVHVTLPDGTPVEVSRRALDGPFAVHQAGGDGVNAGATEVAVPGTDDSAALYPDFGYGFGLRDRGQGAHGVNVVTASGVLTSWAAPDVIPLATVRSWAFAAAQH
jgi:hypothetical protein